MVSGQGMWDRRSALRAAAVMAGVAAVVPLAGEAAAEETGADALFKAGKFEEAGRAYEAVLRNDPTDVHAARQRGYVGLLSNRFADAEKYLGMALALAPQDVAANRLMADCYTRQDKLVRAAPHWRAAGKEANAKWFEAVDGEPYQLSGEVARLPLQQMDPIPLLAGSINGGPPKRFSFYTRIASLNVSAKTAAEAGLRAVGEEKIEFNGRTVWSYYGFVDSFRLGDVELRNVPVRWSDGEAMPGSGDGMIGTWIFYHFLTTFDYAGRSLILRRRTPETAARASAGAERLPLWLAREHLTFSRGSVADSGERVVALHIGGVGSNVAGMYEGTARQLRVRTDYERPEESLAGGQPVIVYPCYPKEVRLGTANAIGSYSVASANNLHTGHGFDVLADFAHSFFKPYNITLDFVDMNVHIGRGKAA